MSNKSEKSRLGSDSTAEKLGTQLPRTHCCMLFKSKAQVGRSLLDLLDGLVNKYITGVTVPTRIGNTAKWIWI